MESATTACAWCGAGGDNGSAGSFVVPTAPATDAALAGAAAESKSAVSFSAIDPLSAEQKDLKGIGGWLILAGVTLVLTPLGLLFALTTDLLLLMGGRMPASLASHPAFSGLLFFDAISDVVLLAAVIVLNIFFYGKRKEFPRWFITFLAVSFVLIFSIHQMISSYLPAYPTLVAFGSFVAASGWIPYFLRSERVAQTFVN